MRNETETRIPHRFLNKAVLVCLVTICISRFSTTMLNMGIYPVVAEYFGLAREINTYSSVIIMAVLAIVASKRPSLVDAKMFSVASSLLIAFGWVLLAYALESSNRALTVLGLISLGIARDWMLVMLYVTLSTLRARSEALFAIVGGVVAGFLLYPLAKLLPTVASVALYSLLPLVLIAPLHKTSSSLIRKNVARKSPSELRIMNPFSFLGPTHPVLVAILLFNIAFGFSLSLNIQQTTPLALSLIGAFTVLAAVAILFRREKGAVDDLFSFAVLLVIAGYIASIAFVGSSNPLANTILTAGSALFSILVYLVVASAIARNPLGMISLSAWAIAFGGLGTVLGADIGHALNMIAAHDRQTAILAICLVLMLFVSYLWLGMRRFSFEGAVAGVAPVSTDEPRAIDDRFGESIQAIGKRFGLTERETEILHLMAKGRNSVFLQEHFVVSKNTIKTHIKHIYRKLDVHSQQEVIDLIEREG